MRQARAAVSAAAAALSGAAGGQADEEEGSLGVSYDLLTAVTERLDDVALFDSSQVPKS